MPADVGERHLVVELVVLDDVALLFTERTQPGFHPDGGGVEVEVVEPSGLPEDDREVLEARETPVPDVRAPEARARAFDRLAPVRRAEDRPGATRHVGSGQTGGRQVVDVSFKRVSPKRLPRIIPKGPDAGAVILGRQPPDARPVRFRTERQQPARDLPDGHARDPGDGGDAGEKIRHVRDGGVARSSRPPRPRERDARSRERHRPGRSRRLP